MVVRIRDPVHNFLRLWEDEVKVVGTPLLQRLRGVKQLALACLVYPGALHTRFDHSLGVTHVAGMMAEALELDKDELELVRLAALLHDVGHGPFSHVSEYSLDRYANRAQLPNDQKREKIHELITVHMIRNDRDLIALIGQNKCDQLAKLLSQGHGQPALRSIVSGPLDADKQDYLLRDSYFCGVRYGIFDIHQLHRSLTLDGPDDEKELMINPDGIHAVEQFVLAKYYLTTNVYRHKGRLITDQMLVRAITLGIEKDEIKQLVRLYAFDNSEAFYSNYGRWDDARFLHEFGLQAKPSRCREMLERLRYRRLLKRVFCSRINKFRPEAREVLSALPSRESDKLRRDVEREIAKVLKDVTTQQVDPDHVIVHAFSVKSVRETARNDEAGILVATEPKPRPFEAESRLFASINERYVDEYVEVYAPVTWSTAAERKRIRRECEKPIRTLLANRCASAVKGAK
ncbi:MAG: HD domain-containing protein [Planctomycetota bacterium]|nr:HD domain-containing protein [Planctomycetota bacterium]